MIYRYNIEGQVYYKSDDGYLIYHTDVENYLEFFEEIKEVKLDVPIGTKFKTKVDSVVYTIISCNKEDVNIHFGGHCVVTLPLEIVNINFKDGTWVIYKEKEFEILELSYEDSFGKIIFKTVSEDKLHLYLNCCKITKDKNT